MALATLCSKLRQRPEGKGLSFTAFIVNHGLRSGSGDEALTVATYLKEIGASRQAGYTYIRSAKTQQICLPRSSP